MTLYGAVSLLHVAYPSKAAVFSTFQARHSLPYGPSLSWGELSTYKCGLLPTEMTRG